MQRERHGVATTRSGRQSFSRGGRAGADVEYELNKSIEQAGSITTVKPTLNHSARELDTATLIARGRAWSGRTVEPKSNTTLTRNSSNTPAKRIQALNLTPALPRARASRRSPAPQVPLRPATILRHAHDTRRSRHRRYGRAERPLFGTRVVALPGWRLSVSL